MSAASGGRQPLSTLQRAWLREIGVDLQALGLPARAANDAPVPPLPATGPGGGAAAPRVDHEAGRPAARAQARAQPVAGEQAMVHQPVQDIIAPEPAGPPFYLVVLEQPGLDDDGSGDPFRGEQGRLLAAMFAAVDLPRRDSVFPVHVVAQRLVGGAEPDAQAIEQALPALHARIARLRPEWIIACGRIAARAVLGSRDELDALRGGPHEYAVADGAAIPVWVTHQPSSLLVRAALKPQAWHDMLGLAQAVRAGLIQAPCRALPGQ